MRFVVMILGILGSLIAGALAVSLLLFSAALFSWLKAGGAGADVIQSVQNMRMTTMGYFLALTAFLALLGSILAVKRNGWQAGVLLLLGCVGPTLLFIYMLAPLSLIILAGLFAFLIRSKPAVA